MSDVAYDPLRYAQAGEQTVDRAFTQMANRRAGRALQQGNYGQAAGALFGNGDITGGQAIQDRQVQQQTAQRALEAERVKKEADLTLRVVGALREVQGRGGDVTAAFDALAPQLGQFGIAPELQTQLRSFISSDESALDQLERLAGQKAAEWEFRDGGGGDVAAVRQTSTGGIESRLAYNAPDRPIVTPSGILLPPQQQGANDTGGAMPPITGSAIQPEAGAGVVASMIPITLQSESQNQDYNSRGGVLTSPAGAQGRMQVMPGTNTDPGYGVAPARDGSLEERARVGRDYLAAMMREYGNDPAKAWAAYNWGPGNLDRAIQQNGGNWLQAAPAETQQYVRQNLAALNGGGGVTPQQDQSPASQAMDVGGGWALTPMQSPADRRAEEQLRLAQNADTRAERRDQREASGTRTLSAQEVEAMGLPSGSVVQQKADGTINVVSGTTERFTEGQRQAAGFAYRLQNAAGSLDRLAQTGTARPSPAILAFGDGRIRENALNSEDRRWLQAAREWLAPVLRKDTGAAVGPGELVTYMGIYLPSPTDDAATLAQKAQARQVAEQALRAQAGGAYDQMFPQTQQPQGRRGNTNAPGLPFNITEQQLATRQRLVSGGQVSVNAARGSQQNPIYVNPADEATSYGNIRPGAWFVRPSDGRVLQKPPEGRSGRRR